MPTTPRRRSALLGFWLLAATVSAADSAAETPLVSIETTGEEIVGRLVELDSSGGVKLLEAAESRVPIDDLLSLRFEGVRPAPEQDTVRRTVELVDGSRFEYVDVAFDEEAIRFTLHGGAQLSAAITDIATWEIGGRRALEVAPIDGASDVLVVKRRDGAFSPVEGVVLDVTAAGVRFGLEDDGGAEPVEAPWTRIGGIRFYRTGEDRRGASPPVVLALVDGGRISAEVVRYADGIVTWSGGSAPAGAIMSIDLSGGRVVSVAELELTHSEWKPYFASDGEGYSLDRSLTGGKLALRFPDRRAPGAWPGVAIRRDYARGVALRSRGELRFTLPAGARRLRGWVGLDPLAARAGSAEASIAAGDELLWSGKVDGATAPAPIDAAFNEASELILRVDYGANLDAGDFINFCDLRVIR